MLRRRPDQQNDDAEPTIRIIARTFARAREQRRVGRPECRTLCERHEEIIDKARMPAHTRKFGPFVVRNLHLWKKETLAAESFFFLAQGWPAAVQPPVPKCKHDHIRQPK